MKEYSIGRVVVSTAGRDKNSYYVITDVVDDKYILVADGKKHRFSSKKKKNIKHISTKPYIYDKIIAGCPSESMMDAELAKYLKEVAGRQYKEEQ